MSTPTINNNLLYPVIVSLLQEEPQKPKPLYTGKPLDERVTVLKTTDDRITYLVDERICVEAPSPQTLQAMLKNHEIQSLENLRQANKAGFFSAFISAVFFCAAMTCHPTHPTNQNNVDESSMFSSLLAGGVFAGLANYCFNQKSQIQSQQEAYAEQLKKHPALAITEERDRLYQKGFKAAFETKTNPNLPSSLVLQPDEILSLYKQGIDELANLTITYQQKEILSDQEIVSWIKAFRSFQHLTPTWIEYAYAHHTDQEKKIISSKAEDITNTFNEVFRNITTCKYKTAICKTNANTQLNTINTEERNTLQNLDNTFNAKIQEEKFQAFLTKKISKETEQELTQHYDTLLDNEITEYQEAKEAILQYFANKRKDITDQTNQEIENLMRNCIQTIRPILPRSFENIISFQKEIEAIC